MDSPHDTDFIMSLSGCTNIAARFFVARAIAKHNAKLTVYEISIKLTAWTLN